MEALVKIIGTVVMVMLVFVVLGLLIAFPIKWCWNYAVVYIWGLPEIGWLHALCLYIISMMLLKSSYSSSSK